MPISGALAPLVERWLVACVGTGACAGAGDAVERLRPLARSNSSKQSTRRALTSRAYANSGRIVSGVSESRDWWDMSMEEEAVDEGAFEAANFRAALPESEEESLSQSETSSSVSSVVTTPPVADEPLRVPREAVWDLLDL